MSSLVSANLKWYCASESLQLLTRGLSSLVPTLPIPCMQFTARVSSRIFIWGGGKKILCEAHEIFHWTCPFFTGHAPFPFFTGHAPFSLDMPLFHWTCPFFTGHAPFSLDMPLFHWTCPFSLFHWTCPFFTGHAPFSLATPHF